MRSPSPRVVGGGRKVESPPCCNKVGLKRGPWTAEEDELLSNYIEREGEGGWRTLPKKAGLLRCGKSCRLRWMNYLRPSIKRGHISADEEDLILRLHRLLGNRWSLIAGRIPGRTDNEIKNYWNTHLSKKLMRQGIDPKTHKPFINPNPSVTIIDDASKSHQCADHAGNNNFLGNFDHHKMIMSSEDGDGDDDEDMIKFCHDDSLSTFLNSLINDDMFDNQHQDHDQQKQHQDGSTQSSIYE